MMSNVTVTNDRKQCKVKGMYSVKVNKENISGFLIEFCLEFDVDIIDDPVVIRTSERNTRGKMNSGYRAIVPVTGSAVFAYFREEEKSYQIHILTGIGVDKSVVSRYCEHRLNEESVLQIRKVLTA